jgi:hypothetical protein
MVRQVDDQACLGNRYDSDYARRMTTTFPGFSCDGIFSLPDCCDKDRTGVSA